MHSTLVVFHPLNVATSPDADPTTKDAESSPARLRLISRSDATSVPRGYRGHLLIVDADVAERDVLAGFLRRRGFRVWVAATASEALAMMAHRTPDMLLLDPAQNGASLIRTVRQQRQTAHLPIIIVSARTAAHEVRAGLALGADDYIAKPVELGLMEARVNALLRREARSHLPLASQEWSGSFLMPSLNE